MIYIRILIWAFETYPELWLLVGPPAVGCAAHQMLVIRNTVRCGR
jgi:hypothetical protein